MLYPFFYVLNLSENNLKQPKIMMPGFRFLQLDKQNLFQFLLP